MAFVLLHCCIMLYKITVAQMQCIEKHKGRKKLPSAQSFKGGREGEADFYPIFTFSFPSLLF